MGGSVLTIRIKRLGFYLCSILIRWCPKVQGSQAAGDNLLPETGCKACMWTAPEGNCYPSTMRFRGTLASFTLPLLWQYGQISWSQGAKEPQQGHQGIDAKLVYVQHLREMVIKGAKELGGAVAVEDEVGRLVSLAPLSKQVLTAPLHSDKPTHTPWGIAHGDNLKRLSHAWQYSAGGGSQIMQRHSLAASPGSIRRDLSRQWLENFKSCGA